MQEVRPHNSAKQPPGSGFPAVPCSPPDAADTTSLGRAGQARKQTRFRLLVVDDEAGVREILSAILAQQGYEIQTAENGVRALELLAQFRPHLVVTDLNMPRMSGLELLQVMRERFPGIPVIVVSGNSPADEPHARADADAFVPKGSGIVAQLGATVAQLLSARAV